MEKMGYFVGRISVQDEVWMNLRGSIRCLGPGVSVRIHTWTNESTDIWFIHSFINHQHQHPPTRKEDGSLEIEIDQKFRFFLRKLHPLLKRLVVLALSTCFGFPQFP